VGERFFFFLFQKIFTNNEANSYYQQHIKPNRSYTVIRNDELASFAKVKLTGSPTSLPQVTDTLAQQHQRGCFSSRAASLPAGSIS
jgi:hypothetical protein